MLGRYRDRLFHPPTRRDSRGEVPRSVVTACPGIERTDTVVLSEFGCPIWRGLCLDVEGTDRSGELILLKLRGSSRDVGETPYLERSRAASQTDDTVMLTGFSSRMGLEISEVPEFATVCVGDSSPR